MLLYHLYVETHFNHTMPGLRNSATPSSQCSPTKFPFVFNVCHQATRWKQQRIWSRHRTLFSWSAGQTCALPEVARKRPKVWIMSYSKIVFHFSGGLAQRDSPTRYTHEESSKSLTNQFFQAQKQKRIQKYKKQLIESCVRVEQWPLNSGETCVLLLPPVFGQLSFLLQAISDKQSADPYGLGKKMAGPVLQKGAPPIL